MQKVGVGGGLCSERGGVVAHSLGHVAVEPGGVAGIEVVGGCGGELQHKVVMARGLTVVGGAQAAPRQGTVHGGVILAEVVGLVQARHGFGVAFQAHQAVGCQQHPAHLLGLGAFQFGIAGQRLLVAARVAQAGSALAQGVGVVRLQQVRLFVARLGLGVVPRLLVAEAHFLERSRVKLLGGQAVEEAEGEAVGLVGKGKVGQPRQ